MEKILLTGGSGFLSSNWSLDTRNIFSNYALVRTKNRNKFLKSFQVDLRDNKKITQVFKNIKPKIVIHTAAITDVDRCEENKRLSEKVNFQLTKKICNICKKEKIKLIFISTDQVFSQKKKNTENFKKSPINLYSLHKSMSEDYIKKNLKDYLIIRTNFFGIAPKNKKSFLNFVKNNLEKDKKINLIEDLVHNPISVHYLIKYLIFLIKRNSIGTFHISSNEKITKHELGIKISKVFNLNKNLIEKCKLSSFRFKAKRPKYMFLDNNKIKKTIKINIPSIQKQLRDISNKFYKGYYKNLIF